jgi:hypothetical protein
MSNAFLLAIRVLCLFLVHRGIRSVAENSGPHWASATNPGTQNPLIQRSLREDAATSCCSVLLNNKQTNKLRGLDSRANYTNRATAACRRSQFQRFADRGCHVVSVTDLYGRILDFLDWSRYYFFQVAPQLYSRG